MGLPEIDGERICIVGGSYGGFSSFASVIRHEDRYRCAVSINGVSDIPLLYGVAAIMWYWHPNRSSALKAPE